MQHRKTSREPSERLPRNLVPLVYAAATPTTRLKMKTLASWTRANQAMPAPPHTYRARGKHPKLWDVNRRLMRLAHAAVDPEEFDNRLYASDSYADKVRRVRGLKALYKQLKPTDRGYVRNTQRLLEAAMRLGFRGYTYNGPDRRVNYRAKHMREEASALMRDARLPRLATLDGVMDRTLQWAARLERNTHRRNYVRAGSAWHYGKDGRRSSFEVMPFERALARQGRIARRAARRAG